ALPTYLMPVLFEQLGELVQLSRRVINNQDASHGVPLTNYYGPSQDSGYLFTGHEIGHVGLDRAQQFFLAERFGEVLVGADDAPLGLVEQAVLGREHDHRRGLERAVVLDQRAGLITVQTRHHDVDKDNVRMGVGDLGQGIEAVHGGDDLAADLLQQGFRG